MDVRKVPSGVGLRKELMEQKTKIRISFGLKLDNDIYGQTLRIMIWFKGFHFFQVRYIGSV